MKKLILALAFCAALSLHAGQLTVSWTWTDGTWLATGFSIERRVRDPAAPFVEIGHAVGNATRKYVDQGVVAGTAYDYRIRAYNDAGLASVYSNIGTGTAGVGLPNGTFGPTITVTPPPSYVILPAGGKMLLYSGYLPIGGGGNIKLNGGELYKMTKDQVVVIPQ